MKTLNEESEEKQEKKYERSKKKKKLKRVKEDKRDRRCQAHPEKQKWGRRGLFTFYSLTQTHWTPTSFPEALHLTLYFDPTHVVAWSGPSRRCTK